MVHRIDELQTSIAGAVTEQSATTAELAEVVGRTSASAEAIGAGAGRVRAQVCQTAQGAAAAQEAAETMQQTAAALADDVRAFTFR